MPNGLMAETGIPRNYLLGRRASELSAAVATVRNPPITSLHTGTVADLSNCEA